MEFVQDKASVFQNVVPKLACEDIIKWSDSQEFTSCKYDGKVDVKYRSGKEIKIQNVDMMKSLWNYVNKLVPDICDDSELIGPDYKRFYLLKYTPGQKFKKHYDGYSKDSKGNKSLITVMIYLNDSDSTPALKGGETRFYAEPGVALIDNRQYFDVVPRTGNMLMFVHKLLHEALPVIKGVKYCIRFNVLYAGHKKVKTSRYKSIPVYIRPEPNGLKNSVRIVDGYSLTGNPNDRLSVVRWEEVMDKPHIFNIMAYNSAMFVDRRRGRPPARDEDYCANCYEILPLENNYQNCSNCLFPVLHINEEERLQRT